MRTRRMLTAAVVAISAIVFLPAAQSSAANGLSASFVKVSDWGSGFEGKITVTNGTSAALASWTVEFDMPAGSQITSSWDTVRTSSGQHYTFKPPTWAGPLGAGASASFGFNGSPGNFSGILNCRLNSDTCTSGPSNPGAPGIPGAPSVTSTNNTSISLSWGASSGTVTGYRVYEGTTVRATVTGTSATISGLGTCQPHTYSVAAYNSLGESGKTGTVTGTTTGCPQPVGGRGAPYLYMGWGNPPNP